MAKTLGIDLGTSSLGWAILDDERLMSAPCGSEAPSAIDCGVVIFPEGMERDKRGALKSRAAERRSARAARRLIFRRKWRKILLLKLLKKMGMCPIAEESIEAWKQGTYPVEDAAFRAWLAATPEKNPYVDRKRAAEEKVDLLTLGRAFYHMAQRRGFKSSRKEQLQELDADENKKTKASDKDLGVVKGEIAKLTEQMKDKTLGQFFYELYQSGQKVRGRHIGRVEHYQKEFDKIVEVQGFAQDISDKFRQILFSQRRLRSQSHLVGWCELEKRQRKYHRAVSSHPLYEAFAAWGFINNLRVGDGDVFRPLAGEERLAAFELLKRRTAWTAGDLLKALRKKFKNLPPTMTHREDAGVPILATTKRFEELGLPRTEWQTAFNALLDFDDLEKLKCWAMARYKWDEKTTKDFLRTNPSEDRGRYSFYAIKKILPWLEQGYLLRKAIFLAKLPEVLPNFKHHQHEIIAGLEKEEVRYHEEKRIQAESRKFHKVLPLEEGYWKSYLMKNWGLGEDGYQKLYVSGEACDTNNPILAPVDLGSYRNPLVCRSLTLLRRLVNCLRKAGKIDAFTRIHVELAHQINSSNECRAIEMYQKDREAERATAVAELTTILKENHLNLQVNDDLILRYLLWEEQNHFSVYTGQPISATQMVTACDIEHTVPRSLGGTSRMENLTLCESHYNRKVKKGLLPLECPNATDEWLDAEVGIKYPALDQSKVIVAWREELGNLTKQLARKPVRGGDSSAYNMARQKWLKTKMKRDYLAAKLGFFKLPRAKAEESGFIPRQLADTGAMTRRAIAYLQTRYERVYPTNGTTTAFARKVWGLQREESKDRSDHTHHALDAMVIAALSRENFQKICTYFKTHDTDTIAPHVEPPYPHFAEQVHHALESILVRHVRENRLRKPYTAQAKRKVVHLANGGQKPACGSTVRGSLHNDTIYGRIIHPQKKEVVTVLRRSITGIQKRVDLEKLAKNAVDRVVGESFLVQIENYVQAGVAEKDLSSQIYWMNKEKGIQLKKLRVVERLQNPTPIRNQLFKGSDISNKVYVSGIDSCVMYGKKTAKGKWNSLLQNLLDVAKGRRCSSVDGCDKYDFSLYPGQLVLTCKTLSERLENLSIHELVKRLYVVVGPDGDRKAIFRYHREARPRSVLIRESGIDFDSPKSLLRLGVPTFAEHMLFEGRDFLFTLDGHIQWIER